MNIHSELMERARQYVAYVRLDDADDIDTALCDFVDELLAALKASEQERVRVRLAESVLTKLLRKVTYVDLCGDGYGYDPIVTVEGSCVLTEDEGAFVDELLKRQEDALSPHNTRKST